MPRIDPLNAIRNSGKFQQELFMHRILSPIADADLAKCTPAAGRYASMAGTTVRPWEECAIAECRLYSRNRVVRSIASLAQANGAVSYRGQRLDVAESKSAIKPKYCIFQEANSETERSANDDQHAKVCL
jgi:hypothetical protein